MSLALFGDDMQQNGFAKFFSLSKRALHGSDIMAIDRTDILQTEIFKHSLWGDNIFNALLHSVKSFVDRAAYDRSLCENFFAPIEEAFVATCHTKR